MRNEVEAKLLVNKPLPEDIKKKLYESLRDGEELLFAISAELLMDGSYGNSTFGVTRSRIISVDPTFPSGVLTLDISRIKNAKVKRMYSNAVLCVETDEGVIETNRFTYSVTELFDAAANYINNVNSGMDPEEQLELIRERFTKRKLTCPKCGRRLSRRNPVCLKCADKKRFATRVFGYVKPYIPVLIFSLVLSSATTAATLIPPYLTKELVDNVIKNGDIAGLRKIVLLLLGIYAFQAGIGAVRNFTLRITGEKIVTNLRNEVYAKAQTLPLKYYDKTSTGSVMSRINGDTQNLQNFIIRISQDVIIQVFTMIGIMAIMFAMNWKLSILSLLPVPIVVYGSRVFSKHIRPFYRRLWKRRSRISSILADTLPGIRVVKAFTSEDRAVQHFEKCGEDLLNENIRAAKITSAFPAVVSFLVMCGGLVIWGLGGYWVINSPDRLTVGVLVSFISYTHMFYGPIQFFAGLSDTFQNALTSAERIFEILDAEPETDLGKGYKPESIKGRIEFRNVSFSYESGKKVLDNVSFVIEPGQSLGIVGATGSGKSTIVNLLMRFYDNYEGEILIDGIDIKDIDLKYYRSQIGYVLQEPMLFNDTIYRNIAYSKPDASVEEVIEAAVVANAHNFIKRLPDAYDTFLGERGVGLSGGEKQRISIARAVLKDPAILILDEATASVDSETENLIQQAIERMIQGRTSIMIAHRLSTLKKADKIIVVDDGKIIESGTHEELMSLEGKYYRFVQIQSLSDGMFTVRSVDKDEYSEIY